MEADGLRGYALRAVSNSSVCELLGLSGTFRLGNLSEGTFQALCNDQPVTELKFWSPIATMRCYSVYLGPLRHLSKLSESFKSNPYRIP